jgi:hypothetical protein
MLERSRFFRIHTYTHMHIHNRWISIHTYTHGLANTRIYTYTYTM